MATEHREEPSKPGLLSRAAARLSRSESELEARELQENTWRLGHTPIVDLADRSEASVCGAIRSVPGTYLTVHGRVTFRHGIPTIFNPDYEIRPDRAR